MPRVQALRRLAAIDEIGQHHEADRNGHGQCTRVEEVDQVAYRRRSYHGAGRIGHGEAGRHHGEPVATEVLPDKDQPQRIDAA